MSQGSASSKPGQTSHASPTPSPSLSAWSGLNTVGQLSDSGGQRSGTPSLSLSAAAMRQYVEKWSNSTVQTALSSTVQQFDTSELNLFPDSSKRNSFIRFR